MNATAHATVHFSPHLSGKEPQTERKIRVFFKVEVIVSEEAAVRKVVDAAFRPFRSSFFEEYEEVRGESNYGSISLKYQFCLPEKGALSVQQKITSCAEQVNREAKSLIPVAPAAKSWFCLIS